jgi:hypothetical protein
MAAMAKASNPDKRSPNILVELFISSLPKSKNQTITTHLSFEDRLAKDWQPLCGWNETGTQDAANKFHSPAIP